MTPSSDSPDELLASSDASDRAARLLAFGLRSTPAVPRDGGELRAHALALALADYEWGSAIAAGGMGVVYRARHRPTARMVAIKVIAPLLADQQAFAERFEQEALSLAYLDHPGIVKVFDFGRAAGSYYLVMEYVPGGNLRTALPRPVSEVQFARIVREIAEALHYAHEQGVVHRDVKPENILLDPSGRVKVADFGLAKLRDIPGPTGSHSVFGTPSYMAPEQILTPKEVDARADIFALGVSIYETLTSKLPMGRFALPSEVAYVSPAWDRVVLRCLEYERDQRYADMLELSREIAEVADVPSSPASPPAEVSGGQRLRRSMFRRPVPRRVVWAAGAAGLAMASVAAIASIESDSPSPAVERSFDDGATPSPEALSRGVAMVESGSVAVAGFDRAFVSRLHPVPEIIGGLSVQCGEDLLEYFEWGVVGVHDFDGVELDAVLSGFPRSTLERCGLDSFVGEPWGPGMRYDFGDVTVVVAWRDDDTMFVSTRDDLEIEDLRERLSMTQTRREDLPVGPEPGSLWLWGAPDLLVAGTNPQRSEFTVSPRASGFRLLGELGFASSEEANLAHRLVEAGIDELRSRWPKTLHAAQIDLEGSLVEIELAFHLSLPEDFDQAVQMWSAWQAAARDGLVGIPECDAYIERYLACIEEHMPEVARQQTRAAVFDSVEAWRKAARAGNAATLAVTCQMAYEAAKKATQAMGCQW